MKLTIWFIGCCIIGIAAEGFLGSSPFPCFISLLLGAGYTRALQLSGILSDPEKPVIIRRIK